MLLVCLLKQLFTERRSNLSKENESNLLSMGVVNPCFYTVTLTIFYCFKPSLWLVFGVPVLRLKSAYRFCTIK